MTSRERVLVALDGGRPDRLPIDFGGSIVTGINAAACGHLKRHLGLSGPVLVVNTILMAAEVEEELNRRFRVDVAPLHRLYLEPGPAPLEPWKARPLPDGAPALFPASSVPQKGEDGVWKLKSGGRVTHVLSRESASFASVYFPLAGADLAGIEAFPMPLISDEELEILHRTARRLFQETDKAVFGWFNGSIFEQAQWLCGWEDFMTRVAGAAVEAEALLEKLTRWVIKDLERYLEAVGPFIQVIGFGDDFGFQAGLQISPDFFRRAVKPRLQRIYQKARSLSPARIFLHSCGAVSGLIEDFIEIGVDALNPVQTSASGMAPERLKRGFGGRIAFWGGGAEPRILAYGSAEEVRAHVRRRLEVLGSGGGYVFAPIHSLQADVPPENIVAMYEEAARDT